MKIRQGFVSNSSSSSFCIYGANSDSSEALFDALKKAAIKNIAEEDPDADEDEYDDDPCGTLETLSLDGMSVHFNYDDRTVYIGRELTTIGDNETGQQFKDSVIDNFVKLSGLPRKQVAKECSYLEECWAN